MATEAELRATVLERFETLTALIQVEYEAAAVHWAAAEDHDAIGHMLNAINYNTTLHRAVETYFTATFIPSDDAILLMWLRSCNEQVGPIEGP